MAMMMNPVMPAAGQDLFVESRGVQRTGRSFEDEFDRHLTEKMESRRDKLGVPEKREVQQSSSRTGKTNDDEVLQEDTADKTESSPLAELLAQFLLEMQDAAGEKTAPGEWDITMPEGELLRELARHAGMGEEDFKAFLQQLGGEDGKVELVDFFAALAGHFEKFRQDQTVSVPETELPLLENLLSRMGVSSEELAQLTRAVEKGDGKVDLTLFLQKLKGMQENGELELQPVELSEVEIEQLQELLGRAGVSRGLQNELLPERFLNQVLGRQDDNAGRLTLTRLEEILQQGLAEVQNNQPKIDLPAFLKDLQQILSTSGFEEQGVGWSPVIQNSLNAAYQKLQEMADLAKIRLSEEQTVEDAFTEDDLFKWVKGLEEKAKDGAAPDGAEDFAGDLLQGQQTEQLPTGGKPETTPVTNTFTVTDRIDGATNVPDAAKAAATPRTFPQQQLQQVMDQLSAGVMRGLRSQEHHLVLRLYPQDLGEVKVDLHVRHEQVSVSFNMENVRVKEMLESNMQEFKDSMAQKGFNLGECSVSVGQQNDGGENWHRYERARQVVEASRLTLADLPEESLYRQGGMLGPRGENGISLFV